MAARLAWLSGGGSCSELESVSSLSLLHSIYGSQVSHVLLASDDDQGERQAPQDRSGRPKSSPAATLLQRQAAARRPATARVRSTAGSAPMAAVRPRSALPRRVWSSVQLEDLEEEEIRSSIHDTKPVALTRVPEYVNFWQGKPLSQREHLIPSQPRRAWQRPKSDYGSRFRPHSGSNKVLGTVLEGADDFTGSDKSGGDGSNGGHLRGQLQDGKIGRSGSRRSSSSRSGDAGGRRGREKDGQFGSGRGSGSKSQAANMWAKRSQKNLRRRYSTASSSADDDDDLFSKKGEWQSSFLDAVGSWSQNTRFELPMDLQLLEGMSPLQYLKSHCIISNQHMLLCSRVFSNHDRDRDGHLSKQEVLVALQDAFHGSLSQTKSEHLLKLVLFPADGRANQKLFAALCCLAGRTFSLNLLPELSGKEIIECVDFEALDWKLRGCSIGQALQTLFSLL